MCDELLKLSQLNLEQIQGINQFLIDNNQPEFTADQINFLANIEQLDVLGLRTSSNLIRGYFGSFDHIHPSPLHSDVNGYDYDELTDCELETINKDDYSESDYKELVKEIKLKHKAKMAVSGLVLSSGTGRSDVLFLNAHHHPLFIKFVNFSNW